MLPLNQRKEAWKSKRVNDHLSVNDTSLVIYDNWMKLIQDQRTINTDGFFLKKKASWRLQAA